MLREPEAQAMFLSFGESTLDFELRVYIPSVDHLVLMRHELLLAIDKIFREHKVEIAFPQRDLHLRSIDPGLADIIAGRG